MKCARIIDLHELIQSARPRNIGKNYKIPFNASSFFRDCKYSKNLLFYTTLTLQTSFNKFHGSDNLREIVSQSIFDENFVAAFY